MGNVSVDAVSMIRQSVKQSHRPASLEHTLRGPLHRLVGRSVLTTLAVSLACFPSAFAQTASTSELTALQKTFAFDDQLRKINDEAAATLKARQTAYAKELDALQTKLQKAGDLNGWEAVTKEAGRFKADSQLSEEQVSKDRPSLRTLQEKYRADAGQVTTNKHLLVFALRAQYIGRLGELQKKLMIAGNIEDAKAVRTEVLRVVALPEVAATEPVARKAFEADYAQFELLARNMKSPKVEVEKSWQTLCHKWNVANAGAKPAALTWNEAEGMVQLASAPITQVVPDRPPGFGQTWINSLGMEFVPVPGTEVLFCKWVTRVQDYEAFAKETVRKWPAPGFEQGPTHPAVYVSWDDAQAFCKWLTEKEHAAGTLQADRVYRLPQDWEWSVAVGLKESKKGTPWEKSKIIKGYPWGDRWPPPKNSGNYLPDLKVDDFEKTSPVGSFKSNKYGLFDMGGNVWEWCEEQVLRGASWKDTGSSLLWSSYRKGCPSPGARHDDEGFRCVVGGSR